MSESEVPEVEEWRKLLDVARSMPIREQEANVRKWMGYAFSMLMTLDLASPEIVRSVMLRDFGFSFDDSTAIRKGS